MNLFLDIVEMQRNIEWHKERKVPSFIFHWAAFSKIDDRLMSDSIINTYRISTEYMMRVIGRPSIEERHFLRMQQSPLFVDVQFPWGKNFMLPDTKDTKFPVKNVGRNLGDRAGRCQARDV